MINIKMEFTITGAKTLSRVLDHIVRMAEGTVMSGYTIDGLCRHDCAQRCRELRNYIDGCLEAQKKVPAKEVAKALAK